VAVAVALARLVAVWVVAAALARCSAVVVDA